MPDAADFTIGLTRTPRHVTDAALATAAATSAASIATIAAAQVTAAADLAAIKVAVDALDLAGAGATAGNIDDVDALVETAVLSSDAVTAAIAAA